MSLQYNIFNRMLLNGNPYQLALLRILVAAQIIYASNSKVVDFMLYVSPNQNNKTIFGSYFIKHYLTHWIPTIQVLLTFFSVCMLIGLFTKWIKHALFITFLLFYAWYYSNFDAPVPWLYLWFPLLIFIFAPVSDVWSVDNILHKKPIQHLKHYSWPVELLAAWFVYIYASAGIAKIVPIFKGLHWLDGGTSHRIIYDRFLDSIVYFYFGTPWFNYAENQWIFSFLSLGSIIIELSCLVILFTNKYHTWILSMVLVMHFFLYIVGVPGFMQLAIILGISLINFRNKK